MTMTTPFESDILAQPAALRALAGAGLPPRGLDLAHGYDRIVFTGMGSSYFAGIPSWRALTARGFRVWSVDTGQLLDTPGLLTRDTLLVATSQSGESGEMVELLNRLGSVGWEAPTVVGVSADESSRLAERAELFVPLHSGPEATVSTKSYLNTLAVHARIVAAVLGEDPGKLTASIRENAAAVEETIGTVDAAEVARSALSSLDRRVAIVGKKDDAATALYAALITKEASKVPAEGFIGGQFRHGPFELAGPGLTAVLYGAYEGDSDDSASEGDDTLPRLAEDLLGTGSEVVLVGDLRLPGARTLSAPRVAGSGLMTGAVVAQLLAVELARANGVTPGAFVYGSKVTTAL